MGNAYFECAYFIQEGTYLVFLAISCCWTVFTGVYGLLFFSNFMTLGKVLGAGMLFRLSSVGISRQLG